MTASLGVQLNNGFYVNRAAADAVYDTLQRFADEDIPSLLHPEITDISVEDYPALRKGALQQAYCLLTGKISEITKPIIVDLLCAQGLFVPMNADYSSEKRGSPRLRVEDVADRATQGVILSSVRPTDFMSSVTLTAPYQV